MAARKVPLIHLEDSVESYVHDVETGNDMTGDDINYGFTVDGAPDSWVAGSWAGSWDPATGIAQARTPVIGGSGSGEDVELEAGAYECWVQIVGGTEQPVRKFDTLNVV